MRTKNNEISVGEYYHLYNRGVLKKDIFLDDRDYIRFSFLVLFFQSPVNFYNLSRPVTAFVRRQTFNIDSWIVKKIAATKTVEVNALCLMPNHFHLLLKEIEVGGISKYLQRILTAYAKYFNTKYKQSGHLFEGVYKTVHIEDNDQLLYTSAYIHKNPLDLGRGTSTYRNYLWSSYLDYVTTNRWPDLLVTDLVLGQFKDSQDYAKWVKNTTAKEINKALEDGQTDLLDARRLTN
ncbi:MAG: transposase [Candidatus Vogelbacteria bacterium]|nr:transposase [Candidatus Vogelbacteria bacterium]